MNAIPQRAYDNYERIQLPRKVQDVQRGRISDMEAYRMQKIAAERRRLGLQDEENERRRVGTTRDTYAEYVRYQKIERAEQQRRMEYAQRQKQMRYERQRQAERCEIRQTGVKNIVGGRRLSPVYEGGYVPQIQRREERRRPQNPYYRSEYVQPRYAGNYGGGYAQPRSKVQPNIKREIENTAYNGVKPIAVEYESPKKKGVISTILLIAFVFAVLSGIVVRYAAISNISYNNAQIQEQNEVLQDELEKIKMDIALGEDLNSIQEKARTELGMYYPTDDQIVYLEPEAETVENVSRMENGQTVEAQEQVPVQIGNETTETTGFFDGLKNFFADVAEAVTGWFQA